MFLMKYDRNRAESLIKVFATVIGPATNQDMFVIAPNNNHKCDCNRIKPQHRRVIVIAPIT